MVKLAAWAHLAGAKTSFRKQLVLSDDLKKQKQRSIAVIQSSESLVIYLSLIESNFFQDLPVCLFLFSRAMARDKLRLTGSLIFIRME